jgi:hypothetical protein
MSTETANSLKQPKRPPTKGSFPKGKSGNPNGRAAKTEEERTLEAMCREKTPQALATILTIMETGESERNRLTAAEMVIDRGYGKARQIVDANITMTLEDYLSDVIANRISKAAE